MGAWLSDCNLMVAPGMSRPRDDPSIVAAVGEHEGQLIVGEEVDLVDRPPGCDMIGLGGNAEHRRSDVL